jgi:hypothetical protein
MLDSMAAPMRDMHAKPTRRTSAHWVMMHNNSAQCKWIQVAAQMQEALLPAYQHRSTTTSVLLHVPDSLSNRLFQSAEFAQLTLLMFSASIERPNVPS